MRLLDQRGRLTDDVTMRRSLAVLAVVGGVAAAAGFALAIMHGDMADDLLWGLPYYLLGLVAWSRRPDLAACRWLLALGTAVAANFVIGEVVSLPVLAATRTRAVLVVGNQMLELLAMLAAIGLFAFFPAGKPQRRYERLVFEVGVGVAILLPILMALSQRRLTISVWQAGDVESPVYLSALAPLAPVADGLYRGYLLTALVGAAILIARYRRAPRDEQRQIRWLVLGAVAASVLLVPAVILSWLTAPGQRDVVFSVVWGATTLIGIGSIMMALFTTKVFDVDRLLIRAVVYGSLWSLIAVAYVGAAALLGLAVSRTVPVSVAIALAILAAVLFQPARRRLERVASRLVYGERVSGYDLLTRLGAVLEGAPDVHDLLPRLTQTVRVGLGLRWARVRFETNAEDGEARLSTYADGIDEDALDEPDTSVPLVHGGTVLGRLECGPRIDGALGPSERRLLDHLVQQAATALHNFYLAAQLAARLELIRRQADELAASRARVIQGQDQERRRIQRDLHDGPQQEVVALAAKLGLARQQLQRGPAQTETTLAELHDDLIVLLNRLRDLAYTIHPPVLTDQGLLEAVEAQAARLPVPTRVEADPALRGVRFPTEVECSAWYAIAEGLTNAVKHADAHRVTIALRRLDDRLVAEVRDDGHGFDPGHVRGLGLAGLADRMDIVGGRLDIDSDARQGTTVRVEIPLASPAVAIA